MILKEFLKFIEDSQEFKQFKETNPDAILADVFTTEKEDWQLDYYSQKKDKITSFTFENEKISSKESELFRKEKKEIIPLNLNNIKIPLKKAIEKINNEVKETPSNVIVVLQVIDEKETWNITYLTTSFRTINFKIDAISGEIISRDETSIIKNIKLGDLLKK